MLYGPHGGGERVGLPVFQSSCGVRTRFNVGRTADGHLPLLPLLTHAHSSRWPPSCGVQLDGGAILKAQEERREMYARGELHFR